MLVTRPNLIGSTLGERACPSFSVELVTLRFFRVDGGIANNDFVLELMSSLTGQTLDRPSQTDMSALGTAFLAGLACGEWSLT